MTAEFLHMETTDAPRPDGGAEVELCAFCYRPRAQCICRSSSLGTTAQGRKPDCGRADVERLSWGSPGQGRSPGILDPAQFALAAEVTPSKPEPAGLGGPAPSDPEFRSPAWHRMMAALHAEPCPLLPECMSGGQTSLLGERVKGSCAPGQLCGPCGCKSCSLARAGSVDDGADPHEGMDEPAREEG